MRALILFILGTTIFALGESLECYNCVETSETIPGLEKCNLPLTANDRNEKCNVDGYCMKGIGTMAGQTVVMRQCLAIEGVPGYNHDLKAELPKEPLEMVFGPVRVSAHFCDSDLCNSASLPKLTISFAVLLIATVFLL